MLDVLLEASVVITTNFTLQLVDRTDPAPVDFKQAFVPRPEDLAGYPLDALEQG